jgi:hypothetical protein
VILIHFLLIFTKFETFQQTRQTISQSDSNSTENYFLRETKIFMFLTESRTVPNTPLLSIKICLFCFSPYEWNLKFKFCMVIIDTSTYVGIIIAFLYFLTKFHFPHYLSPANTRRKTVKPVD